MFRFLIAITILFTASAAFFTKETGRDYVPFEHVSASETHPTFVRALVDCGPSDFKCTSPHVMSSLGDKVTFPGGYKNVFLTAVGGSSSVIIARPDGYWGGSATDMGCAAFGGYAGSGQSTLTNGGNFPVIAWACQ